MAVDQKTGLLGLVTNVGRLAAPAGSLEVANNVVIRKNGVVEPRPGMRLLTAVANADTDMEPVKAWSFDSSELIFCSDGTTRNMQCSHTYVDLEFTKLDGSSNTPFEYREDMFPHAESRGNMYIGCDQSVFKLGSKSATELVESGLIPMFSLAVETTVSGTMLAHATGVSYRAVLKRKDSNGLVVRSHPTGASYIGNGSGATKDVEVTICLPDDAQGFASMQPGDEIEVYRTRAFDVNLTVDEEYALVASIDPTVTTSFTDSLADSGRGAALYTSPSQGGASAENGRPPAAGCMELFRGHLFLGNTIGPYQRTFSVRFEDGGSIADTDVGYKITTGTTAVGSPLITGIGSLTAVRVGMVVAFQDAAGTGFVFPQGTYVVSIDSASQVTVSENATEVRTGQAVSFLDSLEIDGTWFPVLAYNATNEEVLTTTFYESGVGSLDDGSGAARCSTTSQRFYARSITPPEPGYTHTILLSEVYRSRYDSAAPTLRATHGEAYYPAIPNGSSTAEDMQRDVLPNGIVWSKRDEPEHFAPVNFARVGDAKKEILGLAATRDSLFILKEDGIWRLSGPGGNDPSRAWRIDPFDMTTFCVLPQSVQKLNGKIYFLSNKGIVRLSESGVEVVSAPIGDQIKSAVRAALDNKSSLGYYALTGNFASAVNPIDGEYMLAGPIPTVEAAAATDYGIVVYNEASRAWSTWQVPSQTSSASAMSVHDYPKCMSWSESLRCVLAGITKLNFFPPQLWRFESQAIGSLPDYVACNDGLVVDEITSVTTLAELSWSINTLTTLSFSPGDVVVDSEARAYVVVESTGAGTATVTVRVNGSSFSAPTVGECTVVAPVRSEVRVRPHVKNASADKRWTATVAGFSEVNGVTSVRTFVYSNTSGPYLAASNTHEIQQRLPYYEGRAAAYRGLDCKMLVPSSASRGRDLWQGVKVDCAMGNWQLESFAATSAEMPVAKQPTTISGSGVE